MPRLNRFQFRHEGGTSSAHAETQRDGSLRLSVFLGSSGLVTVLPADEADALANFIIECGIAHRSSASPEAPHE